MWWKRFTAKYGIWGERGRFREYKSGGSRVWGDIECRSKATREVGYYYELKPLGLDNRTTLILSNTRELNRDLFTN